MMPPELVELVEVEIDDRSFFLRPVGPEVWEADNVVAAGIAAAHWDNFSYVHWDKVGTGANDRRTYFIR